MKQPITISGISTVSALGCSVSEVWKNYLSGAPLFERLPLNGSDVWASRLSSECEERIEELVKKNPAYRKLDRTVLMAISAARNSLKADKKGQRIGINIGSSRGATELFESYHREFLESGVVSAFTSPTTTLGNISSNVAQDLGVDGFVSGHSVTCSTALHAVLNGIAWLRADMADLFLAGGSEAALTPFTIAQMQAMKLYSRTENVMACESMRFQKKQNTMVFGEGAGVVVLENGVNEHTKVLIAGYGFASEKLVHNTSISEDALCFQRSMKMALANSGLETVDVVIMHAPGTVKGDMAEKAAVDKVFGKRLPLLTSNKWIVGHTFAVSGLLSIEMAILMLDHNRFIENPFYENARHLPDGLKTVMINAVGFGGNAVSIIIAKPDFKI